MPAELSANPKPYIIDLTLDPESISPLVAGGDSAQLHDTEQSAGSGEDPQQRAQALALQYAEEIRQLTVDVGETPRRGRRRLFWGLGVASVMLVGAILTVALTRAESEASRASRLRVADICQQRQIVVMRAINRFTREHGQPPRDLQAVRTYLSAPPVDPTSGVPYRYTQQGDLTSVSCPDHPFSPPRPSS